MIKVTYRCDVFGSDPSSQRGTVAYEGNDRQEAEKAIWNRPEGFTAIMEGVIGAGDYGPVPDGFKRVRGDTPWCESPPFVGLIRCDEPGALYTVPEGCTVIVKEHGAWPHYEPVTRHVLQPGDSYRVHWKGDANSLSVVDIPEYRHGISEGG